MPSAEEISASITAQGDKIRQLKTQKAAKAALKPEIDCLLALKADYKAATGTEWKPEAPAKIEVKEVRVNQINLIQNGILIIRSFFYVAN